MENESQDSSYLLLSVLLLVVNIINHSEHRHTNVKLNNLFSLSVGDL